MLKKNSILILFLLFTLAGTSLFYFSYYGYQYKLTEEEIKQNINEYFSFEANSFAGTFVVNGIDNIEIYEDGSFYTTIKFKLISISKHVYDGEIQVRTNLSLDEYKEKIYIGKQEIIDVSIDDSFRPLSNKQVKLFNHSVKIYLIIQRFQARPVYDLTDGFFIGIAQNYLKGIEYTEGAVLLNFKP